MMTIAFDRLLSPACSTKESSCQFTTLKVSGNFTLYSDSTKNCSLAILAWKQKKVDYHSWLLSSEGDVLKLTVSQALAAPS